MYLDIATLDFAECGRGQNGPLDTNSYRWLFFAFCRSADKEVLNSFRNSVGLLFFLSPKPVEPSFYLHIIQPHMGKQVTSVACRPTISYFAKLRRVDGRVVAVNISGPLPPSAIRPWQTIVTFL